jgi:hypothetical protein
MQTLGGFLRTGMPERAANTPGQCLQYGLEAGEVASAAAA